MIKLNLHMEKPSYLSVVKVILSANAKLVESIFKRIDACRKEHKELSEIAAKRHYEKLAAHQVQFKKLSFIAH